MPVRPTRALQGIVRDDESNNVPVANSLADWLPKHYAPSMPIGCVGKPPPLARQLYTQALYSLNSKDEQL